jgi:hypothetical protein
MRERESLLRVVGRLQTRAARRVALDRRNAQRFDVRNVGALCEPFTSAVMKNISKKKYA